MTDTENSKTWITSKSIAIAARIPHHLHDQIKAYGLANYPKGDGYDKTATIIDLIARGLESDGSVQHNVIQDVNRLDVTQSVIQDVKQELLNSDVIQDVRQDILDSVVQSVSQDVRQGEERLKKLEVAIATINESIAELKDTQDDLYHRIYQYSPLKEPFKEIMTRGEEIYQAGGQEYSEVSENLLSQDSLEDHSKEINDDLPLAETEPPQSVISEREPEKPDIKGIGGLTQTDLGKFLGLPESTFRDWIKKREKGEEIASRKYGKPLAEFLEWEVEGDRWFKINPLDPGA